MLVRQDMMRLSFSVFDVRSIEGEIIPVMCVEDEDRVEVQAGVLAFIKQLKRRRDSLQALRAACFTLGLLRDFYLSVWKKDITAPGALLDLVAAFLKTRRSGIEVMSSSDQPSLRWAPVGRDTIKRDRRTLTDYALFCTERFAAFSILPLNDAQVQACRSDLDRLLVLKAPISNANDFLGHIARFRSFKSHLAFGGHRSSSPRTRSARSQFHLPLDDVRRAIDATKSPMQKMLLIEAFFGGPRISELLNQWRCDILPGRYRPYLFPDDQSTDVVLAVLADPQHSHYTGTLKEDHHDRTRHLLRAYKLRPRPLLAGDPYHAGWKGIDYDNSHLLVSQVFWANLDYARYFADLFKEVHLNLYANVPTSVMSGHPYLFINDDPSRSEYGQPMKISNARKTFQRAIGRLRHLGPQYKTGTHGARHFYENMLESYMPGQYDDIAKCMHHKSISSQKEYSKGSAAARRRLCTALREEIPS